MLLTGRGCSCAPSAACYTEPMASKPKQPAGSPMSLGNMRHLGVQRLIASCLNDAAATKA
jgi:hypothetical protein